MSNGASVQPSWGVREYTIMTGSLVVGALALYGILHLLGNKAAPGDEPPIHVKGGSIELLLGDAAGAGWNNDNGWVAVKGKRNSGDMDLVTMPMGTGTGCQYHYQLRHNESVTLTFRDTAQATAKDYLVTFNVNDHKNNAGGMDKKTTVNPNGLPLNPDTDARLLENTDVGFVRNLTITKVTGPNTTVVANCDFAPEDKFHGVMFEP